MTKVTKYRVKPDIIEAVQWTGDNIEEVKKLIGQNVAIVMVVDNSINIRLFDYVTKNSLKEISVCRPEHFNKVFEKAELFCTHCGFRVEAQYESGGN